MCDAKLYYLYKHFKPLYMKIQITRYSDNKVLNYSPKYSISKQTICLNDMCNLQSNPTKHKTKLKS